MRLIKGSYFTGYLEIQVLGENPEHFLQKLIDNGVMLWEIKKLKHDYCTAMVHLQDVSTIKKLRFRTHYKIRVNKKYGIPFINKAMRKRKPLLFGLLLSVILFFILSNMIWKVEVAGVPEEVENKIVDELKNNGIYPGAVGFTIDSPNQIQQLLLENVPELLWVGVEKRGTSFYLEGVEKLIIEEEERKSPRHLIADKNGVIKSMYVKRGLAQVSVNDFVEKGNVLVSGLMERINRAEEDDEDLEENVELVVAEGEVIATTWYKAEVEVPLEVEQIDVTGNIRENYRIQIGSFSFPIWPWRKNEYENEIVESEEKQLNLFGLKLPFYFISENRLETVSEIGERTKAEAVQIGIEQVKNDLERELGYKAKITSEKVLHETIDRGKVNLSLYITVEENIAIEEPINQGD